MSWRHTRAVGELDLKRPPVKAVLLSLAHHADEYTGQCYPSIARLILFTGLSERAVQSALVEAEQLALIKRDIGRGKKATLYTLTVGVEPLVMGARPAGRGAGPAGRGAGGAPQQSENSHRNRTLSVVPEDWWPAESAIAQAKKENPDVDVEHETRQFVEYNRGKGTEFANIGAGWRSWINRAKGHAGRGARGRTQDGAGYLDRLAAGEVSGRA